VSRSHADRLAARRPLLCETAKNKTCVGTGALRRRSDDEGASGRGHRSRWDALLHDQRQAASRQARAAGRLLANHKRSDGE